MAETEDLLAAWSAIAPVEDAQWASLLPGPSVVAVSARLSTVPSEFLDEQVSLRALAGDLIGIHHLPRLAALRFANDARVRRGTAIGLWLIASEILLGPFDPPLNPSPREGRSVPLLQPQDTLPVDALGLRLAPVVDPAEWIADAERREEAVRTFLLWNGQLPAGEQPDVARAALAARDSLRFNEALAASFAEHRHRDELRRRLEEARAREAAARYTRE